MRRRCTFCRRSGFAINGRGMTGSDSAIAGAEFEQSDGKRRQGNGCQSSVSDTCTAKVLPQLLFTENETNTAAHLRCSQPQPLRQRQYQRLRRPWTKRGREPGEPRDQSRRALSPDREARAESRSFGFDFPMLVRMPSRKPTPMTAVRSDRISKKCSQPGARKPTSSTRRSSPPRSTPMLPTSCARHWRVCYGPSSFTTTTWTEWLEERGSDPFKPTRKAAPRNDQWHHMYNGDVISMPDKWEYPWYAAWDLAFHVLALTLVDPDFGKQQLKLMLRERYMHPNGQIPAYEWNFGDVNPPVHAWSTIFTYRLEKAQTGKGDTDWLKSSFQKLLLNFTWWVNRKDRSGRNVFEGGFLGLDNIGVFDRSSPLPTGGYLEQADGTAWMALFCQNMLEIAVGTGA